MIDEIETVLNTLRRKKPLILNLTNYVTMDFMANSLLALGAAPMMTVCHEELEELIQLASCVNINIGTLDKSFIERCNLSAKIAHQYQKPIVLDPVGAGASHIRTTTAKQLMLFSTIIKGNASEIMALATLNKKTYGVESTNTTQEAKESALTLSNENRSTIVISGEIDFITNGKRTEIVPYGSNLMSRVTGMGCILSAIISAFRSVLTDDFEASLLATYYFALCGELTAKTTNSPSTFRVHFIDNLYTEDFDNFREIYNEL